MFSSKRVVLLLFALVFLLGLLFGYGVSAGAHAKEAQKSEAVAIEVPMCQPSVVQVPVLHPVVREIVIAQCGVPSVSAVQTDRPRRDPTPIVTTPAPPTTTVTPTPPVTETPSPTVEPVKTKHPNKGGGNGCEGSDPGNHPEKGHDDETPCL